MFERKVRYCIIIYSVDYQFTSEKCREKLLDIEQGLQYISEYLVDIEEYFEIIEEFC